MKSKYLHYFENKTNLIPNFWMSEDYIQAGMFQEIEEGSWIWLMDGDVQIFPKINKNTGFISIEDTWCLPIGVFGDFLDYNFIYDCKKFLDLSGKKFESFRKNIKKAENRLNKKLEYCLCDNSCDVLPVFTSWLEKREDSEIIQDGDVILNFLKNGLGTVKILTDGNEIYGFTVSDENKRYVNFRYCFTVSNHKELFLSELLRYLFFMDNLENGKLINDGGCLDNQNLYRFKLKLNPISIFTVYSNLKDKE